MKWAVRHFEHLPQCLVVTCGGWFGHLVGEERRAPEVLQQFGGEWMYRMVQQPRLAPRYAQGFTSVAQLAWDTVRENATRAGRGRDAGSSASSELIPGPRTAPESSIPSAGTAQHPIRPRRTPLEDLLTVLWGPGCGAVVTDRSPSAMPEKGMRTVDRMLVTPGLTNARFIIPASSETVMKAALTQYNGIRQPRVRAQRSLLAAALEVPGADRLLGRTLTVQVPENVLEGELATRALVPFLAAELGHDRLHAAAGVRGLIANAKPTIQLFDDEGSAVGFAKVGWNAPTRALVKHEAETLRWLAGRSDLPFAVPHLTWFGEFAGLTVAVVAPMPQDVRRIRDDSDPHVDAILALSRSHVARSSGSSAERRRVEVQTPAAPRLDDSEWWNALLREVGEVPDAELLPSHSDDQLREIVVSALSTWVTALTESAAARTVPMGPSHGDWVPWNIARRANGSLFVWDWEHARLSAPVGFDLLHHTFQVAYLLKGRSVAEALDAVDAAAHTSLPALGVEPGLAALVSALYCIDLTLRELKLTADGVRWNEDLMGGLLTGTSSKVQRARDESGPGRNTASRLPAKVGLR